MKSLTEQLEQEKTDLDLYCKMNPAPLFGVDHGRWWTIQLHTTVIQALQRRIDNGER